MFVAGDRFVQKLFVVLLLVTAQSLSVNYAHAQSSLAKGAMPLVTEDLTNRYFKVSIDRDSGGVMSLRNPSDEQLNYVLGRTEHPRLDVKDSRWLGDLFLRYRVGNGPWRTSSTGLSGGGRQIEKSSSGDRVVVKYSGDASDLQGLRGITLTESWRLEGDGLIWTIEIENRSQEKITIGDLGVPLLFNSYYVWDPKITYEQRVVRHSYIAGDNSHILWTRANGIGPYLLMTPGKGTRFEYFDRTTRGGRANSDVSVFGEGPGWEGLYTAYVHAAVQAGEIEDRGSWNQPLMSRTLAPKGQNGDAASYTFKFQWVDDYPAARKALIGEGLLDVQVAPGMVIPSDLEAMASIGASTGIESVTAQYPAETKIVSVKSPDPARRNWRFKFGRLGENNIVVRWGGGRETRLEYFVTEPLSTLINKRSAFLVKNQQVRGTEKWYEGLFSLWDMKEGRLRTPDDTGGLHKFMVGGSDDPTLGKAPYIASKNVVYPDPKEIEAVEYYLEHFVWGKLQRTDHESPFPYGIYGSDNWFENRNSKTGFGSGGHGQERMWRTFDYTHLIQLYFQMYRIARLYPGHTKYLDADGYLERAYRTAMAFFEIPYNIKMANGWSFQGWTDWAYKQGAFHELYIVPLIKELDDRGRKGDAAKLKFEWEKKVKYFVYDTAYPFGSEMHFDTTGFQSAHAVALYGLDNQIQPAKDLWEDKNSGRVYSHAKVDSADFRSFMDRAIRANISARGWMEANYYQLGSDYRQTGNSDYLLSYMTQMGGAPILDYALNYENDDGSLMRLGYASYLGSWGLMNSGTESSGYGYWFKGKQNDGAASWAFKPEKYGPTFTGLPQGRGGWRYDGEIDNGFSDALLGASTVAVEDRVFGLIALGGDVKRSRNALEITPKDGVGQRLHVRTASQKIDVTLDRDGFDTSWPVKIISNSPGLQFRLSNRYLNPHETRLDVGGLPPGRYLLTFDGRESSVEVRPHSKVTIALSVGSRDSYLVALTKLTK